MIGTSNAALQIGSYTVAIGSHQWDVVDGAVYYGRSVAGPYGVEYTDAYNVSSRTRQVRFVKSTALIEQLRELTYRASLTATKVKFTPDTNFPGTFWWLDWPDELTFETPIENRHELTVTLAEQSPGA